MSVWLKMRIGTACFTACIASMLQSHAFEPGNLRYDFLCRVSTEDRPAFAAADYDDRGWPDLKTFLSRRYQVEHLVPPGGILWNRVHLTIGAEAKGKDLTVVVEDGQVLADVYLNGRPLPSCWRSGAVAAPPRRRAFALPADLIRYGAENILALRYYYFYLPREDTLGRVEWREAEPMDRVQVGLGGCNFAVAPRTDAAALVVSSGLCREQLAKVVWRVEDYYGAEMTNGEQTVTLGPQASATVAVPLPPDDRAYKVVAWPETEKGRGLESWGYIGKRNVRTEFRETRLLASGWEFAFALGVKELKPPAPKSETLDDAMEAILVAPETLEDAAESAAGPQEKEARNLDGKEMEPFAWWNVNLPHVLMEEQRKAHRMWYRTKLAVPREMAGKRIALWFYHVAYQVDVFVGNEFVARKPMWELPGEVDLTGKVTPGGTHMLWLGVTDYIAAQDPALQAKAADGNNAASGLLAPVNGFPFVKHSGIPSVPELRASPLDSRIDWVGVESIVDAPRKVQRLKVTVNVAHAAAAEKELAVQADVLLKGKLVRALPAVKPEPASGRLSSDAVLEADFPEGQCWTLDTPTLYQLRARLIEGGKVVDETNARFGFRQFGTAGRYVTLNGHPIRVMGSDQWLPRFNPRLRRTVDMVRLSPSVEQCMSHCVAGGLLDVYDETGCLVMADDLDSNACTRDNWAWEDARLYRNIASKFRSLIRELYNHPAIVIWSWGCEFPFYCGNRISDAAVKMACEAENEVQRADPTRFASFTSLGRGRGFSQSRLLSTHSEAAGPGEYATIGLWYYRSTNDAPEYLRDMLGREMMESGAYGYLSLNDRKQSRFWDGAKPVFNCETGYTGWDCDTDDQLGCFLPGGFWMRSGAWFQSEVARGHFYRLGQTWTRGFVASTHCAEGAGEEQLAQTAVFPKYWEDKFWGGTKIDLPIFVVNNYLWPEKVQMQWGLYAEDGRRLAGGEKTWAMEPSRLLEDVLPLDLPAVKEAAYARLIYTVRSERYGLEYRGRERLTVFPPSGLAAASKAVRVAVYDPAGATVDALRQAGAAFQRLTAPADRLAEWQLLIIGENAVDGSVAQARDAIAAAVSNGLTCAVLFQDKPATNFPDGIGIGGLGLNGFAYLVNPRHPLAKGLLHGDFRWWSNPSHDHLVQIRPAGFPPRPDIRRVVAGELAEVVSGKGRYVVCQLPLARDMAVEPAAAKVVENLVALSGNTPAQETAGRALCALEVDRPFASAWAKKAGSLLSAFPPADPRQAVLLARGQTLMTLTDGRIKKFLEEGGTLWLTGVNTNKADSGVKPPSAPGADEPAETEESLFDEPPDPVSWLATNLNLRVKVTALRAPLPGEEGTERRAILKRRAPILDGIANGDLGWDVGDFSMALDEPGFLPILEPSFLVVREYGKGRVVLDNLRWPSVPGGRADYLFLQLAGWVLQ